MYYHNAKERFAYSYMTCQRWLELKIENKLLSDFFTDNHYNSIAIYGYGDLGKMFYQEMKNSEVKIDYFIDREYDKYKDGIDGIKMISPEATQEVQSDVIVVTPVFYYLQILTTLVKTNHCEIGRILSLNDVIFGMK